MSAALKPTRAASPPPPPGPDHPMAPEALAALLDDPATVRHQELANAYDADRAPDFRLTVALAHLAEAGLLCRLADRPGAAAPPPAPPALTLVGADAPLSQGSPTPGSLPPPPAVNHAAEQSCLAHALAGPAALADDGPLADLRPEHFHDRQRRTLFALARDLAAAGQGFDAAILAHEASARGLLPRNVADQAVGHLLALRANPALAADHAAIVRADAERRAVAEIADELRRAGASRSRPEELAARARGLIERLDGATAPVDDAPGVRPWPAPPAAPAWRGVAGELALTIDPHTEADPAAVLAQSLVSFGSVLGRSAHWTVDGNKHFCNLFCVVVGQSSRGRKGTSWSLVRNLVGFVDPNWKRDCHRHGLVSGEGAIEAIRDESVSKGGDFDAGVEDKRCLWIESEFSGTIGVMGRDGSTLSAKLRQFWDGDDVSSHSRNNPVRATNPHVSVIGHTTFAELSKRLGQTEVLNGFANRFLWVCARRSKCLPEGGDLAKLDLDRHRNRLGRALAFALKRGEAAFAFDAPARALWHASYPEVTRPRAGRLGAVTDRAEAQARRLAVVYAALDRSPEVRLPHLEAALAFWDYCERSAAYIFGDVDADPFAEKALAAVRAAGEAGATRDQVNRAAFGGREPERVAHALRGLAEAGLLDVRTEARGRRSTTVFLASGAMKKG